MAVSVTEVLSSVCPRCKKPGISDGFFRMRKRCPECDLNLYPEPGYYLGAMMAAFLITAGLMIPVIIILKVIGVEPVGMILAPLVLYAVLCPVITHYARIFWVHLEYQVSDRWERDHKQ